MLEVVSISAQFLEAGESIEKASNIDLRVVKVGSTLAVHYDGEVLWWTPDDKTLDECIQAEPPYLLKRGIMKIEVLPLTTGLQSTGVSSALVDICEESGVIDTFEQFTDDIKATVMAIWQGYSANQRKYKDTVHFLSLWSVELLGNEDLVWELVGYIDPERQYSIFL